MQATSTHASTGRNVTELSFSSTQSVVTMTTLAVTSRLRDS